MKSRGWVDILSRSDGEALWAKLFRIISRHSAVRMLYPPNGVSGEGLRDLYCDLTQELFLKLHQKDRWTSYLSQGFTDEEVEQQLYRIEVPNLISRLQREKYPEAYRIARRISYLLQTRSDFRYYQRTVCSSNGTATQRPGNKMALRVYGLSIWPPDKVIKPHAGLADLIKEVDFRRRDTRRTGRGSGSQVIISNEELRRLIFDTLFAIDTPTDVRTIRSLVLSKLAVEDCRMVSIDEATGSLDADDLSLKLDLADKRPTPLEILLEKETNRRIDGLADDILKEMRRVVRNKAHRFRKLIEVAWHCYFNQSSPSQSSIASMMGISDSLVSHYRRIFDNCVFCLGLGVEELIQLDSALDKRLAALMADLKMREAQGSTVARRGGRRRPALYSDSSDGFFPTSAPGPVLQAQKFSMVTGSTGSASSNPNTFE